MFNTPQTTKSFIDMRSIDFRMVVEGISFQEVLILDELLFHPNGISFKDLEKELGVNFDDIKSLCKRLVPLGILTMHEESLLIERHAVKWISLFLSKFDDDIDLSVFHIESLLKQLPVDVLFSWYSIPRSSENIFQSIIERWLLTPHDFRRHLRKQAIDDPLCGAVIDMLNAHDVHEGIYLDEVKEKLGIPSVELHSKIIYLEYHFICALKYRRREGKWRGCIVFLKEWREYISFYQKVLEGNKTLEVTPHSSVRLITQLKKHFLKLSDSSLLPCSFSSNRSLDLNHLIKVNNHSDLAHSLGQTWDSLSQKDQESWALALLQDREPLISTRMMGTTQQLVSAVYSRLSTILGDEWVAFDRVASNLSIPFNVKLNTILKKEGQGWRYIPPQYEEEHLAVLEQIICSWLFHLEIVDLGSYGGVSYVRRGSLFDRYDFSDY
ncbi:MAG: hypothetical protein VXZ72_00375 [Chlamydiota bacterium]|nr:hypothetical protein [Chlamydiota bacterium]